jgi:hypothetical protein
MKRILLIALLAAAAASAQDFPSRAITLIVPNPPGGMNQIHAQPLGAIIEKLYKQPAPVINKPGATAAAGTAFVANSAPDGYNVLVTTPNIYLAIEKDKLFGIDSPYKLEQLAPIALLSADPLALSVQVENPVKSVKEFVAAAKAKNGELVFSSSGLYSITHIPMQMILDASGKQLFRDLLLHASGITQNQHQLLVTWGHIDERLDNVHDSINGFHRPQGDQDDGVIGYGERRDAAPGTELIEIHAPWHLQDAIR